MYEAQLTQKSILNQAWQISEIPDCLDSYFTCENLQKGLHLYKSWTGICSTACFNWN